MNASEEVVPNYFSRREDVLQVDVTKRWHSNLEKRMTLFLEIGLSGMALNTDLNYGFCNCLSCDCAFPLVAFVEEEGGGAWHILTKVTSINCLFFQEVRSVPG
ncbi:MAG: hypothetical protein ACI9RM_001091 [Ulvibacter sp.]|jgi:hypothetical protein